MVSGIGSKIELWGGVFPTLVRDYYRLRLRHYHYVPFLPLLVFHHILVLPQRPTYPFSLSTPHHTTPLHSDLHFPPLSPRSSVHLEISWFLVSSVSSSWVLGVSSGVPFLYHSRIFLSSPLCSPQSPGPTRSTPDPRAPNFPSLPPPSRWTSL